ncbi:WD repeat-containing protein 18 [Haemaphysalis longicornis]
MASFECIFTTDGAGQLWNACVWDPVSGSVLAQYKGGTSSPRTLCLLGADYVISAQHEKPILRVWSLQRRDQIQKQIVCPGKVSALATSPDGIHCVAGIQEKIYLWQVPSGSLLAVLGHHFQPITCLRFSDDGGRFVSASRDGQVLVWDLAEAAAAGAQGGSAEPIHAWTQHSYDVTDLHIGLGGGGSARCYSVSADRTCRVFAMDSGELLATVVLEGPLTAVVADPAEDHVFAGASTGKIFEVALYKWNASNSTKRPEATFLGHDAKVTCLSVSLDGQLLVSGSDDHTARVWDVASKQCIHIFHHKGAVTNAFIVPTPIAVTSMRPAPPTLPLGVFKRSTQAAKDPNGVSVRLDSALVSEWQEEKRSSKALPPLDWAELLAAAGGVRNGDDDEAGSTFEGDEDLEKQVAVLKEVNKQLYSYAWSCVLRQQQQQSEGSDTSMM